MMKLLALVALLAAVVSAGTLPDVMFNRSQFAARLGGKIINGVETTIEKNPHQVSIRVDGRHYCGGSIISKHWVLTAAHCLDLPIKWYGVLAGTADQLNKKSPGSIHKVDRIISHPGYGHNFRGTMINDVGLIHVSEPFEFDDTRQPIELFNKNEEALAGSLSVITGWGDTHGKFPRMLNLVEVPIITKTYCGKLYAHKGRLPDGQICAAYDEGGKDACQGDSGGPLSIDGRLAGIVSWGEGCAEARKPGVYTEVAYFRDWIKSTSGV